MCQFTAVHRMTAVIAILSLMIFLSVIRFHGIMKLGGGYMKEEGIRYVFVFECLYGCVSGSFGMAGLLKYVFLCVMIMIYVCLCSVTNN